MDKYKSLHLWMLIPMLVMQLGIFYDYWGDFTDNAWSVHIHYVTGSIWYFYLVIQPYFATHGHLTKHRTNGIIGMFLAGGVCITALSMLQRDIVSAENALMFPEDFGPFQSWFFYGVIVVEIVMITAFGYAVIMSIIQRKKLEDHAWWLISTVFLIMMPALARGVGNVQIWIYIDEFPNIDIMAPLFITQGAIMAMLLLAAWKYKKIKHPATYLAIFVIVFTCFLEPLGKWETMQTFLKTFIK